MGNTVVENKNNNHQEKKKERTMSITLGSNGVIGAGGERERPGRQQRGPEVVRDPVLKFISIILQSPPA